MSTLHINSRHFMRLVQQGDSNDYLSGHYHFDTLHSGISLHGGRATAEQDLHCSRLTDAYVNFVILLEGRLDFGINRERYCIRADGGARVWTSSATRRCSGRRCTSCPCGGPGVVGAVRADARTGDGDETCTTDDESRAARKARASCHNPGASGRFGVSFH